MEELNTIATGAGGVLGGGGVVYFIQWFMKRVEARDKELDKLVTKEAFDMHLKAHEQERDRTIDEIRETRSSVERMFSTVCQRIQAIEAHLLSAARPPGSQP